MKAMVEQRHKLALIVGPTAIGKTEVAVEVASLIEGEIISADSVQVFKGLDIGSGKITPAEAIATNGKLISHHLISILSPREEFNVTKFKNKAEGLIPEIIAKGKAPILVGGTGLYIEAVIDPYNFPRIPSSVKLRERFYAEAVQNGNEYLH
ncbi:MAG: isopentenyl transferase family protein, partial [Bacillota bacterium]